MASKAKFIFHLPLFVFLPTLTHSLLFLLLLPRGFLVLLSASSCRWPAPGRLLARAEEDTTMRLGKCSCKLAGFRWRLVGKLPRMSTTCTFPSHTQTSCQTLNPSASSTLRQRRREREGQKHTHTHTRTHTHTLPLLFLHTLLSNSHPPL